MLCLLRLYSSSWKEASFISKMSLKLDYEIYFIFNFFLVNDILFSHFCLQLNPQESTISNLAHELLVDTRKSFNLVLHIVLLRFVQIYFYDLADISLNWILLPMVSLGKTKSSRITYAQVSECSFQTLLLIFCTYFSSWLRQNSLNVRDNVLLQ